MGKKDLLLDECACGHVLDEHEHSNSSTPPCTIEGCDCFAFESVEGSEAEDA
jgi:hypothetical protein